MNNIESNEDRDFADEEISLDATKEGSLKREIKAITAKFRELDYSVQNITTLKHTKEPVRISPRTVIFDPEHSVKTLLHNGFIEMEVPLPNSGIENVSVSRGDWESEEEIWYVLTVGNVIDRALRGKVDNYFCNKPDSRVDIGTQFLINSDGECTKYIEVPVDIEDESRELLSPIKPEDESKVVVSNIEPGDIEAMHYYLGRLQSEIQQVQ